MYKLASKQKVRFQTSKGSLGVENLWDLSITELDVLAVSLEDEYKESGKKSFLVKKSEKDKTAKLKFDIVLDILTTKIEEQEVLANAQEVKAHNQKIMGLIQEKKEESLKNKSVAELERMIKK